MKKLLYIILVSSLLISCGNQQKFTTQKYTSLKSINYSSAESSINSPEKELLNDETDFQDFSFTEGETNSEYSHVGPANWEQSDLEMEHFESNLGDEPGNDTIILTSGKILIGTITSAEEDVLSFKKGEKSKPKSLKKNKIASYSQGGKRETLEKKKSKNDDLPENHKRLRKTAKILMLIGLLTIVSIATPFGAISIGLLLTGIIMWLVSMEMKRRYLKKNDSEYTSKKSATSILLQILGWLSAAFVAGGTIGFYLLIGLDL